MKVLLAENLGHRETTKSLWHSAFNTHKHKVTTVNTRDAS